MERLKDITTFLLDLDGTFYLGDELFPWSLPFVEACKQFGKRFIFVTNNSSQNGAHYVSKLRSMGVEITADQVFTSGQATIFYLKKYSYPKKIYLLGTPALEEEFSAEGFCLTDKDPEAVVLGFDLTLTYEKLERLPFHPERTALHCHPSGLQLPYAAGTDSRLRIHDRLDYCINGSQTQGHRQTKC